MRVYKFYADWCGPCKAAEPIWEIFKGKHNEYEYIEINVDDESERASLYEVMGIPCFIGEDGNEVRKHIGVPRLVDLEKITGN